MLSHRSDTVEPGDPSRSHKWVLLVASSVSLVCLVTAALRESVFAPWRQHQAEYARILRASAADETSRRAAAGFRRELRQVTVPGLKAVDRCVTCHTGIDDPRMADQPEPYRFHPGDYLKLHPISQFGCTSCHRGQGAAVTFREAKADTSFWHDPMLPKELTQASCGSCHDPRALKGRGGDRLALGAYLFRERGCRSCHSLDGRGGTLGPALDRVGLKTRHEFTLARLNGEHTVWNWHDQHFQNPGGVVANSKMPVPQLTREQRLALITFVLSLQARDYPRRYLPDDRILLLASRLRPAPADGRQLYREFCRSCHGDGSYTRWNGKLGRFIPAIRGASFVRLASRDYVLEHVRQGRPGTEMPAWHENAGGLTRAEQEALVDFLLRREGAPGAARSPIPEVPIRRAGGSARRGRELFQQQCAGCHGIGGRGGVAPTLASPTFQSVASDAYILATIRQGRVDTPMPAFQPGEAALTDPELMDILAYVRSLAPSAPPSKPVRSARAVSRPDEPWPSGRRP